MRRTVAVLCAGVLASSLAAGPVRAGTTWEAGPLHLEVSGSLRELALATHATSRKGFSQAIRNDLPATTCLLAATFADCPAFRTVGRQGVWQSLTRLRTRFELAAPAGFSATVLYDHEWRAGTLKTLEGDIGSGLAAAPFLPLQQRITDFSFGGGTDTGSWRHLLYRAFLTYESRHVEVIAGRQRIAWGVGRLWTPMDRLNFIPPLAIESDQSPGVDALDAKWLFSGFTYLEMVLAPRKSWRDGAYATRLHGVLKDTDYSLVAGSFAEARSAGLDLARNVGDAAARLSVIYTDPERDVWPIEGTRPSELPAFWQVLVSSDRNLEFAGGLYVLVEYLYNGNALGRGHGRAASLLPFFAATGTRPAAALGGLAATPGPFVTTLSTDSFGGSQIVTGGRHHTGVQLGYDLLSELRGELVLLYDWDGGSAAIAPFLRYDPFDFLEVTAGTQFFAGPPRSEYGAAQTLGYLLLDAYF